jgi:hypothetical protein
MDKKEGEIMDIKQRIEKLTLSDANYYTGNRLTKTELQEWLKGLKDFAKDRVTENFVSIIRDYNLIR